jgi:hypothetical protein
LVKLAKAYLGGKPAAAEAEFSRDPLWHGSATLKPFPNNRMAKNHAFWNRKA